MPRQPGSQHSTVFYLLRNRPKLGHAFQKNQKDAITLKTPAKMTRALLVFLLSALVCGASYKFYCANFVCLCHFTTNMRIIADCTENYLLDKFPQFNEEELRDVTCVNMTGTRYCTEQKRTAKLVICEWNTQCGLSKDDENLIQDYKVVHGSQKYIVGGMGTFAVLFLISLAVTGAILVKVRNLVYLKGCVIKTMQFLK